MKEIPRNPEINWRLVTSFTLATVVAPGPTDDQANDVVMMDDFIYGEPHHLR